MDTIIAMTVSMLLIPASKIRFRLYNRPLHTQRIRLSIFLNPFLSRRIQYARLSPGKLEFQYEQINAKLKISGMTD